MLQVTSVAVPTATLACCIVLNRVVAASPVEHTSCALGVMSKWCCMGCCCNQYWSPALTAGIALASALYHEEGDRLYAPADAQLAHLVSCSRLAKHAICGYVGRQQPPAF
jgi:hypothetical protein